jgi:membrane associated rhomboid family serine protease
MGDKGLLFLKSLWIPFLFVILMALLFLMETEDVVNLHSTWGIRPREWRGFLGTFTSPLMHGSWEHVFNNSVPILVLGTALIYFYPTLAFRTVLMIWISSGLLVWLTAREGTNHIGASGLVYGLVTFIFFSGVLRKYTPLIALSMLVIFLYGGLVWGVLPIQEKVSWEGHLWGAVVGAILAFQFKPFGPQRPVFEWENEENDGDAEPWYPEGLDVPQFHQNARPLQVRYIYKSNTPKQHSEVLPSPPEHTNPEEKQDDSDGHVNP